MRFVSVIVIALLVGCSSAEPSSPPDATTDSASADTRPLDTAVDSAMEDTTIEDTFESAVDAGPGASGSLDTTFAGGAGYRCFVLATPSVTVGTSAQAIAVAPDGKIVLAGHGIGLTVARFTADGDLDMGFGSKGGALREIGEPGAAYDRAFGVAVLADKRILLGGMHQVTASDGGMSIQPVLAQLTESGAKDTTFAAGSWFVMPNYGSTEAAIRALAVAGGKIVVAGVAVTSGGQRAFVARHLMTGALDSSFGSGGVRVFSFDADKSSAAYALVVRDDGSSLVAGGIEDVSGTSGVARTAVARFDASGTLDMSFGTGGVARANFTGGQDILTAIAVQSTGAIVATGVADGTGFLLARFTAGGALDTTFAGGGGLRTKFGSKGDFGMGVAILSDDRIVLGGSKTTSFVPRFALEGYLKDGAYNTSFGTAGHTTTVIGTEGSQVWALARLPDNRILAGGDGNDGMCVARYWP